MSVTRIYHSSFCIIRQPKCLSKHIFSSTFTPNNHVEVETAQPASFLSHWTTADVLALAKADNRLFTFISFLLNLISPAGLGAERQMRKCNVILSSIKTSRYEMKQTELTRRIQSTASSLLASLQDRSSMSRAASLLYALPTTSQ